MCTCTLHPSCTHHCCRPLSFQSSSSSESEHPVKRPHSSTAISPPKKRRKKSKARTKLSPLLENACSPIPKADHAPSPLTQTHSTTPTRPPQSHAPHSSTSVEPMDVPRAPISQPLHLTQNLPRSNTFMVTTGSNSLPSNEQLRNPFLNPSSLNLGLNFSQPQPTCVIPQLFPNPAQNLAYPVNPLFAATPPVIGPTPIQQPMLSPTHQYPRPLLSPPLAIPQQNNPYLPMSFYLPHTNSYRGGGFVQLQVMPSLPLGTTQNFVPPSNSFVGSVHESSLNTSHNLSSSSFLRRDEKLKSVPPRFIFSNMGPEGKVS